ncbi:hypothetical protein MYX06_00365 [Patescibacteria group bacterium AH-259-L05]|nr:hypothetical protein [Patescibacteria group bacterium AH-259-L05]
MLGDILIGIGMLTAVAMFWWGVDRMAEFFMLGRKRDLVAGAVLWVFFSAFVLIVSVPFPIF